MVQLRNFFILENIESHLWLTLIIHSFQVNTLNTSEIYGKDNTGKSHLVASTFTFFSPLKGTFTRCDCRVRFVFWRMKMSAEATTSLYLVMAEFEM